ncbi:MAG: TIGR02391 family protein [Erysipelotrichales bacterium]|nr:TIGR02391 family protein [Erysipelotrichales bacterium]
MTARKCLTAAILEGISQILGDTENGLTGSQIHKFLLDSNIDDIDSTNTKWKRLYSAFANFQNTHKCSNNILNFISFVLSPARYVNKKDEFERIRELVNQQLAFAGYLLKEDGQFKEIEKASIISDVQIKADNLKKELEKRNAHCEIFKYCKVELLQNNYFHAVFEANKGLFERIRELSGLSTDGSTLY